VGVAAVVGALNPPQYLQDMSVFASSGLAACFLVPMVLGLYWKRMNAPGAMVAMAGGCGTHVALYVMGYLRSGRFEVFSPLGLHPFLWDLAGSMVLGVLVARLTPPPAPALQARFFGAPGLARPNPIAPLKEADPNQ
jgi:sodium/pantothenate symporter